jgi:hypothetical protein
LQEDIRAGKFIVDLTVGDIPVDPEGNVQFTCPVCGTTCTIPERFHAGSTQFNGKNMTACILDAPAVYLTGDQVRRD